MIEGFDDNMADFIVLVTMNNAFIVLSASHSHSTPPSLEYFQKTLLNLVRFHQDCCETTYQLNVVLSLSSLFCVTSFKTRFICEGNAFSSRNFIMSSWSDSFMAGSGDLSISWLWVNSTDVLSHL